MLIAQVGTERIVAQPGITGATCPACGQDVVAKCGELVAWHWAHKAAECDAWSDGETLWHTRWKMRFPAECREVVMGPHRADVKLPSGTIIEFQRSHLSIEDLRAREEFYGDDMLWVVCADDFRERLFIRRAMPFPHWPPWRFSWGRARQTWMQAQCPVIFDAPEYVPVENRINDEQVVTEWHPHPWKRELFLVEYFPEDDSPGAGNFIPLSWLISGQVSTWPYVDSQWVRHDFDTEDKPTSRALRGGRRPGVWAHTIFDIDDDALWGAKR